MPEQTAHKVPKMRTAEKALAMIREEDPETSVSLHQIRRLIKTGKIPFTQAGTKKLINMEYLYRYLEEGEQHDPCD
ncbi:MAG: DNA-binding protein [Evtepia sp.]|uniref:DNA-binding protein n=1 Tax=Evtepia sp. TaxID=2773933 RepID=UPI002A75A8CF|nr:DNA-binding protein [Evtepia sp.]MDY3014504.1 DNA-binding protein [Evtepia sp.]